MSWKYVQRNTETGQYRTTSSGGGGGSSNLADLDDVDLNNLQDGQIIKWDAQNQKFVNANESGGSSLHTYSTTEQKIGTWIDGKEVYELTVALSSSVSISTGSWRQFTDIITTDWFLVIEAVGVRANSGVYVPLYASHNSNTNLELRGISTTYDINYIIVKYVKSAST